MKKQIIIDTDPGCDDAIAIILTLNNLNTLDLKMVSVTGGNTPIEQCAVNASFIVDNFTNKNIPVFKGEEFNPEIEAKNVHGAGGLGNVKVDASKFEVAGNSIEEMYKVIMGSSQKTIIAELGPCTNLAKLLETHPDCKKNIDYVFLMAGSMNGRGNIKPYAEFNVYSNPWAFDKVISSGVKVVLCPMELGENCSVKKKLILNRNITNKKEQIIHDIIDGAMEENNPEEFYIFDAQVVMGLLFPELYEFKPCKISLSLNKENLGQTFVEPTNENANAKVQIAKNSDEIQDKLLFELYRW